MSPAPKLRTKSKDKTSAKSAKEQQNTSIKPSGSTNTVSGNPANAYNPISGTFHTLEIPLAASSPPFHDNGRFRNIDDMDEHSSSPHGTVSEYDSVSNNGSCSGESEDPKDRITNSTRQETVLGLDNDKREKIRLKNEKKHQRQRERRAQELHERCSGYLMSRKLEKLSHQLVAMGFSHELATLALVLNEGKVEESVNWLVEKSEEEGQNKDAKFGSCSNLKIDISDELAQISAMEVRCKCSKQDVERAVVACEGDLVKAEEILRAQKQESTATPARPEETVDTKNVRRLQGKAVAAASVTDLQRMNEQDFNYKTASTVPMFSEPVSRILQPLNQPKLVADTRWATTGPSTSFSSSVVPPMQAAPPSSKLDARLGFAGIEGQNAQQTVREPVTMMQRPQSINSKQNTVPSINATPSVTARWYSDIVPGVDNMRSNGKLLQNTGSLGVVNQSSEQFYHPMSHQESSFLFSRPVDPMSTGLGVSWGSVTRSPSIAVPSESQGSGGTLGLNGKSRTPLPSLAAPSSLGLFTGSVSSPHVDWNTGGMMPEFDYTSIDWTVDSNMLSSKSNGLWLGLSSFLRNTSGTKMNSTNSSFISGLCDSRVAKASSTSAASREWTSPFAEKDIFSLPRQFVTSPSP